ncbi:MAG: hypothetical protein ABEJ43_03065 [Haloferacaceae archaeon]
MRRRVLLSALGASTALFGGCTAGIREDSTGTPTTASRISSPQATTSPVTTSTSTAPPVPTPTNCPTSPRVPPAEPHPDGLPVPSLPDPPASLEPSAVEQYAEQYEIAYRRREVSTWYDAPITGVDFSPETAVRRAAAGHVVVTVLGTISGTVNFDPQTDSTGNFDGERRIAAYLVTEAAVWRAAANFLPTESAVPDPVEDGTVVECY